MKANKVKPVKAPRKVETFDELCAMPRDNVASGAFWMLTDSYEITIAEQKIREMPSQKVSIPRDVFDAFVDWYMTGVWNAPRKGKKVA